MLRGFLTVVFSALFLTGCATTSQQKVSDLELKVGELERQVEEKDAQIKDLQYTVKDMSFELNRVKSGGKGTSLKGGALNVKAGDILRVNVAPEKLQQALRAAGYYEGVIDGKLGMRTKVAISKFQKDNGLKADGVVGEKTWGKLKGYLTE